MLALVAGCSSGAARTDAPEVAPTTQAPSQAPAPPRPVPVAAPTPDLPTVSKLIDDAIAQRRLPGAVIEVGHGGTVVFRRAYGDRKLDGEQGLDGKPSPAEPMTEDTIFDVASLTKPLATATAVMQLYEQGEVAFDDPVQKYLPEFNASHDPQRARVTVRMLLTHTSGEPGDVDLKDPWGLEQADKSEGIRRALTTPLQSVPGSGFHYSDINFVLLGALVERVTGEPEDNYVQRNIFAPLGMSDTRYLPAAKACGPHEIRGAAIAWAPNGATVCSAGEWSTDLLPRIAPTALDEESRGDPVKNPDIDHLLRGTVHDPTARRMGGVSGHAGVFSTVHDVGVYAQALLDRLAGRASEFPLSQATAELMTTPQQPGHTAQQVPAANGARADRHYPAIWGQNLRGFGWDIDTGQSMPRGLVFPVGSFGHTGFTGTMLWIDPGSDTYVVLFSNAIQVRGSPPMTRTQGEVDTAVAQALGLYTGR